LKLGLQGYTIFIASGDSGVYPRDDCSRLSVGFPASSPYVTAAGSTYYDPSSKQEIVVDFSGGGFSQAFSRPFYQEELVSAYVANLKNTEGSPDPSLYNAKGRAVPDVSALGTNF